MSQKTKTLSITVKNIFDHTHIALWLSRMWYGCLARVRASLTYCFQIKFKLFFFYYFQITLKLWRSQYGGVNMVQSIWWGQCSAINIVESI